MFWLLIFMMTVFFMLYCAYETVSRTYDYWVLKRDREIFFVLMCWLYSLSSILAQLADYGK